MVHGQHAHTHTRAKSSHNLPCHGPLSGGEQVIIASSVNRRQIISFYMSDRRLVSLMSGMRH